MGRGRVVSVRQTTGVSGFLLDRDGSGGMGQGTNCSIKEACSRGQVEEGTRAIAGHQCKGDKGEAPCMSHQMDENERRRDKKEGWQMSLLTPRGHKRSLGATRIERGKAREERHTGGASQQILHSTNYGTVERMRRSSWMPRSCIGTTLEQQGTGEEPGSA